MKADWCGFGAAEYDRQMAVIIERAQARTDMVGVEAVAEMKQSPGAEVVEEAVESVRRRWVQALMRRGDPRSAAVAAFLGGDDEDRAVAQARLQALARTASDPMVTALALQRPCAVGGCTNIEASQWSRLEPANLQAWLTLMRSPGGGVNPSLNGYALERMASEARYSRTYEREFKAVLLSLPQSDAPGLSNLAEMQLILGTAAAWAMPGLAPLSQSCRAGLADPATRYHCEVLADRLWEQDTLLDRAFAIGIARRVIALHPDRRARWEARAQRYEAAISWRNAAVEGLDLNPSPEESPCGGQVEMRQALRGMTAQGEWDHLRAEMRSAGADDATLSARFRQAGGRSVLDPESGLAAASTASR
ncbi:hypothetical protein DBR42_19230 [Pelomonas sp. HMWF004]|nr:hypothetical protein DBR42_19230 [Pelomonas sp. HMWF004]